MACLEDAEQFVGRGPVAEHAQHECGIGPHCWVAGSQQRAQSWDGRFASQIELPHGVGRRVTVGRGFAYGAPELPRQIWLDVRLPTLSQIRDGLGKESVFGRGGIQAGHGL